MLQMNKSIWVFSAPNEKINLGLLGFPISRLGLYFYQTLELQFPPQPFICKSFCTFFPFLFRVLPCRVSDVSPMQKPHPLNFSLKGSAFAFDSDRNIQDFVPSMVAYTVCAFFGFQVLFGIFKVKKLVQQERLIMGTA
ncbi:hypothetical protein RHMOL_Rhmol05G0143800 [Rhododendron molle]|uniref:Uncharacterized protein n=1 Tax=Rhododendron molle TaxID=49168 RepID=A0ACC0NPY9_RHOML|nr:hypothetical protein RHMOL_Rhmol05G0143800 [Rhododendron molle]